jgi:uncharacterized protein (DUF1330 family)
MFLLLSIRSLLICQKGGESMPAYCFFDVIEITHPEKMEEYRLGVFATVEQYSGRYVALGGRFDVVEGDWRPAFPVIIEFPSFEQARGWYDSPEYRPLKALRLAAAKSNVVIIEGR